MSVGMRYTKGWLMLIIALAGLSVRCTRDTISISRHESGEWGSYELWEPPRPAQGLVFFFSGAGGFQSVDRDAARTLIRLGAAVALVNTDVYRSRIDQDPDPDACLYLPGAVEWTSHYLQQYLGLPCYHRPLLLGKASGAGIVYALLVQGSPQSFAGAMSVDFTPLISLRHPLCNHHPASRSDAGQVLDSSSKLCAWWHAGATQKPSADTIDFVRSVCSVNSCATTEIAVPEPLSELVTAAFAPVLKHGPSSAGPAIADAVVEVSAKSSQKTLAVIYSGDGGWRDIDRVLGNYLAGHDIAVVGINCLSYFWKKRTPEEVGRDLGWLLRCYLERWGMRQAVLIGYSFGADILPPAYNRLPQDVKEKIAQLSLLAPSRAADFEFHFSGWLSSGPSARAVPLVPEIKKIDTGMLQCFYGEQEAAKTLCTDASLHGAEIIRTVGSHHFDGNYAMLGNRIAAGVLNRSKCTAATADAPADNKRMPGAVP